MIRLLSTDFDGTLVNHFANPPVALEFLQLLGDLRASGVVWAVNTGRAVHHIVEGLDEFGFPFRPDFILTSERDVFRPGEGDSWEPYGNWNERCAEVHRELLVQSGSLIDQIRSYLEDQTEAKLIFEEDAPVGIIASDEEEMDTIVDFIDEERYRVPEFYYQRNTMYLRFCHSAYHKGAALGELARLLGLGKEEIFAAGDHLNDLSMLDGRYASFAACPANAVDAVKDTVRSAAGYVASAECSAGVLEALMHFLPEAAQ